jgi:hypothetical protein
MCQIQLIHKLDGSFLNEEDLKEFEKLMCFGSLGNDDAWGVFSDKFSIKQSGGFNKFGLNNEVLKKSKFIIGHNRLATSGEGSCFSWNAFIPPPFYHFSVKKAEVRNHHPFILRDLVLVHNGIINNSEKIKKEYNIKSKIQTDSYAILYLIDHYLNKNNETNRTKKIVKAIQKTTEKISGSYSVFLYDKKTDNLFYFKNFSTNFTFKRAGNLLIGSTNDRNLDYVFFGSPKKQMEIKDNHIYLINKTNILKDMGGFKEKTLLDKKEEKEKIEKFFKKTIKYIPEYRFSKKGDILIKKDEKLIDPLLKHTDVFVGDKYIRIPVDNIDLKGGIWFRWFA